MLTLFDIDDKLYYNIKKINKKTLIKSSGGTGPMKLGNQHMYGAKSCRYST